MTDLNHEREHTPTFDEAVEIHLLLMAGERQSRIAPKFRTNQGRISEINTGKRHPGSRLVAERISKLSA